MTTEDLLNYYYKKDVISLDPKGYTKKFEPEQLLGMRVTRDVKDPKSGEVVAREGRKFNKAIVRQLEAGQDQRDSDRARRNHRPHFRP